MRSFLAIVLTGTVSAAALGQVPIWGVPSDGIARGGGQIDVVLWDNGADAGGLTASQLDLNYPFDAQTADDFTVPAGEIWSIESINFNGGFFGGTPVPFDMNILIYADAGGQPTGGPGDPSGTALFFENFAHADTNETSTGNQHFNYDVTLSTPFEVGPGTYWIAAQGVGFFAPQWGFATSDQQQGNLARQGFPLLGVDYWVTELVADSSFSLSGTIVPEPATLSLLAVGGLTLLRRRR